MLMVFNDLKTNDGLYGYFISYIFSELKAIISSNEEIMKFFEETKIPVQGKVMTMAEQMDQDFKFHHGRITKKYLKETFRNWDDKEKYSSMSIYAEYICKHDKIYISSVLFQISRAQLCHSICKYINDLDHYKKELDLIIRHEVGHFIDYIRNRHGIDFDEYVHIMNEQAEEYKKYYDETCDLIYETLEEQNEINRKYYNMKYEKAANDAIGISVEDFIKLDEIWDKKYKDKEYSLNIEPFNFNEIHKEE